MPSLSFALPSLCHPALDAGSKEDARIGVLDPGSEAGMTAEGGRREERGREDRGPGTVKIRKSAASVSPSGKRKAAGNIKNVSGMENSEKRRNFAA